MASTVRAAVLRKPKTIELAEFPRPSIGADDALLRIEACGICGSDYEQYEGAAPLHEDYTQYPGHPRPRAARRHRGDRRPGAAALGRRRGRPGGRALGLRLRALRGLRALRDARLPQARRHLRLHRRRPSRRISGAGTPSTCTSARTRVLKKMDPAIPAGVAVMFNPLAAGLSWAAAIPATAPGDRVVILGAGQRGLCCVIGARAAGARQVVITGLTRDAAEARARPRARAPTPPSTSRRRTWWRACARRRAGAPRSSSTRRPMPRSRSITPSPSPCARAASSSRASRASGARRTCPSTASSTRS